MKTSHSRTHFSHRHDDQDEGEAPVAMVPAVGLKTNSDKPFSFPFAQKLMVSIFCLPVTLATNVM